MRNTWCCIYMLLLFCNSSYSQDLSPSSFFSDTSQHYFWICKQHLSIPSYRLPVQFQNTIKANPGRTKLLAVSGELGYAHFDRNGSSDDLLLINSTSDIFNARLNIVYKETYPFNLSFRYNKVSPFQMDNQYELNLGFDQRSFRELLLEKVNKKIKNDFEKKNQQLYHQYEQVLGSYEKHKKLLESPVYAQQMAEERLRQYRSVPDALRKPDLANVTSALSVLTNNPLADKFNVDKLKQSIADSLAQKSGGMKNLHERLLTKKDSLLQVLNKMEDSLLDAKKELTEKLDSAGKAVSEMANIEELKKYADRTEGQDAPKGDKLMNVLMKTNVRLGKFLLNNSELTVTNIFLHGASIKYGEEKFVQVSGGVYDFAFREVFNFRDTRKSLPKTTVFAVKAGRTDGKNLEAATFYTGKKTKRGSATDELETVAGVALEKKFYFGPGLSLDVEVAKSTTLRNSAADKDPGTFKDLFGTFSTKTIGIYSSLNAYLPKTKTEIEAGYRYWGQQFQSFNASQYFNPQNNLSGRIKQSFFNRRLTLAAGAKYTDFKSFGVASNMKTKTIFASFNSILRIKKLPILSAGYYPGSQLYWVDQSRLYEYFYYIFNGTASHYFRVGKMPMQVVFTYTRFLNNYKDSVVQAPQYYYNLFWTAWKEKFTYTVNLSRNETEQSRLYTIEGGLSYSGSVIRIGSSLKWNLLGNSTGIGYSFNGGVSLKKIGTVNFIYDRSFLPDRNGSFIPVSMGQLQIIKPLNFSVWQ
jgi:hypothetical protein